MVKPMRTPRRLALALVTSVALTLAASPGNACEAHSQTAAIKKINVEQLATLLAKREPLVLLDANTAETRAKYGAIPGAKLLTSYASYAPTELPADKAQPMVFYCGSDKCTAAPKAAQRAVDSGYTNVSILDAGIKGWVSAGHEVVKPSA